MGLCDEERFEKMMYGIKGVCKIVDQWKIELTGKKYFDEHHKIFPLVERLYPAILGNQSNSLHWFMGSDSVNKITEDGMSPWSLAVRGACQNERDNSDFWNESKTFDAKDGFEIRKLLPFPKKYVFELYQHLEYIVYAVRRYNDSFLKTYQEISDICSHLQGECFRQFTDEDYEKDYPKAYLVHQIVGILYSKDYPYKNDFVDQILMKHNLHHDLRMTKLSLKELTDIHIELVKFKTMKPTQLQEARLRIALVHSKSVAEHAHIREAIAKKIGRRKKLAHIPALMEELAAGFKDNKENESSYDKEHKFDDLDVYGYQAFRVQREVEEE